MTETWFTSDTHFGHKCALKWRMGNFNDIEQHDDLLIKNWNNVIGENDTVYHLGDVSFISNNKTIELLNNLNGTKHLVIGNHDYRLSHSALECFQSVSQILNVLLDGKMIVLCHYPLRSWHKQHYGSWHLHGHSHGSLNSSINKSDKILDVGVDTADIYLGSYRPFNWEEIKEFLKV